jgi:3-hydroxyacyl-CoA dehydrogenase/enoyl-CoA hydratase/3-hydroxybutyryl-CoA epimerase
MPESVALTTNLLRLEIDDGVATVWIDDPDASVNKISRETLDAFSEVLGHLEEADGLAGVVFISGKEASFVVGADLHMLATVEAPAEVRSISRRAHRLLWRVENLPVPTVAAIEGPCMGGGLELTLGCDYRIASTHDATKLALPEVRLGLLPGGGGTQYLPRLVGVQEALTMMLTGKNTYPKKARDIGLVDALIHPPGLYGAARRAVHQLANGTLTADRDQDSLGTRLLENNPVSRRIIYRQAASRTESRTRGNYPAPPRIIDAVKTGLEKGIDRGLDAEMRHFGELVFTPESRALVQLFFGKQEGETHPCPDHARSVRTVGLLGAGRMGGGIAEVTAANDVDVVLKDQSLKRAARGKRQVWSSMNRKKEKGILNQFERDRTAERVVPVTSYEHMAHADLVLEAVPEDLALKHQVLSEVERVVSDETILATNTSSLPIADIAAGVDAPERVVGMHYFSPVPDIPLVELVTTEATSETTLATAYDLALTQGKTVIVVNDGPGFYTTRILALFLNEALLLLEEGADVPTVDETMRDAGFPMGPYELLDFVGMDVAAKITEVMGDALAAERLDISDAATRLADAGLLGQKANIGFYHYGPAEDGDGKARKDLNEDLYHNLGHPTRTTPAPGIVEDRLLLMLVNEAVRCLEDGVLRSPTDGDVGAVFGLGFPPFLGGPFRYIDQQGPAEIAKQLRNLAYQYGDRFEPADLLTQHEDRDTTFHG